MNKAIEKFIPIADMLAEMLGNDVQIIIYDLTSAKNTVAHSVNDCADNRPVLQDINKLIMQLLLANNGSKSYSSNNIFITQDKRLIKSSVSLISDDDEKIVGAFYIGVDMKKDLNYINWLLDTLSGAPGLQAYPSAAKRRDSVQEYDDSFDHISKIADDMIDKIIGDRQADKLGREDKVHLVNVMESKGLFMVKGVMEKVAERLGIAKVTVYTYLHEIKEKEGRS